jgi:hypothetical protein
VIPDDSLTREPVIHIVESDVDIDEPGVSPVEGLVEPSFSIGLTPLSHSGISKPLLVNKSSLITCSPHSTLIAAGQISEPQPLSPIRERSFAESPPSAALLSTGMIHLLFPTLFLYYVFYFFQIWATFLDYDTREFEDAREHIVEEPEEGFADDSREDPFEEPEEVIEDLIIQGTFSSLYVLLL